MDKTVVLLDLIRLLQPILLGLILAYCAVIIIRTIYNRKERLQRIANQNWRENWQLKKQYETLNKRAALRRELIDEMAREKNKKEQSPADWVRDHTIPEGITDESVQEGRDIDH